MRTEGLAVEQHGHAVHLVVDRPEKYNAFTQAMWDALPGLVAHAERSPGARALVVRSSNPRAFSAGADIEEYRANAGDAAWGVDNADRVVRALDAVRECPLVTVAVVTGACVGGGAALAVACDLRVADETAVFGITPARLGLVYPYEDTVDLVDLVGPAAARRLLLTGDRMDADWALRVGLVDDVVARELLDETVDALVASVAGCAPVSVRALKRQVALVRAGQRHASAETRALMRDALSSADHAEGTRAFLERRAPRFG